MVVVLLLASELLSLCTGLQRTTLVHVSSASQYDPDLLIKGFCCFLFVCLHSAAGVILIVRQAFLFIGPWCFLMLPIYSSFSRAMRVDGKKNTLPKKNRLEP